MKPSHEKSRFRFILLVTYWILGFVATHMPLRDSGEVLIPNLDKIAHFVLYLFLSLLMAFWLGTRRNTRLTIQLTVLVCFLYAILDEGGQVLVPSRHASVYDFLADCAGVLCGVVIYGIGRSFSRRP